MSRDYRTECPSVLAVLSSPEDHAFLRDLFAFARWRGVFHQTFQDACRALREQPVGVVLSECRFDDGHCWADLLTETLALECPPPLIVTDRLADNQLWAEVLNRGGYDVLLRPLDGKEVLRVVGTAWLSWRRKAGGAGHKPPRSASGARSPATARDSAA
jgi:DNA-binding response OmpR family regulator